MMGKARFSFLLPQLFRFFRGKAEKDTRIKGLLVYAVTFD